MIALDNIRKIRTFGLSMYPLFHDGDILYFKPVVFSVLRENDIVVVKKNKRFFTHRIVYKSKSHLILKGDNNLKHDGIIRSKQIVGKVYKGKRNGYLFNPELLYMIQSSSYFQAIAHIKKMLEMKKVSFVFLKGLPLHLYYYKSSPRRIYADCDVLVRKEDTGVVDAVMRRCGFKLFKKRSSMFDNWLQEGRHAEIGYIKYINGFPVIFDIHTEPIFIFTTVGYIDAFYPRRAIKTITDVFMKEKRMITIQSQQFPVLNAEQLITYLSLHFMNHNFHGIFRLSFLDRVIRSELARRKAEKKQKEFWIRIEQFIHTYSFASFVYPTLLLLKKYYKTPIPSFFMRSVKPSEEYFQYIQNAIVTTDIFSDKKISLVSERTRNLFFLSPHPYYQRLLVFLNIRILIVIAWLGTQRLTNRIIVSLKKIGL